MNTLSSRSIRAFGVVGILSIIFFATVLHSKDKSPVQAVRYIQSTLGFRPSFYEIALKYGTDKVTDHHYERLYERRLAPFRDKRIRMVEIGLGCNMDYGPGASYYTWLEYFPHVDLYYIEYDEQCAESWKNKTAQATVFTGDQANIEFLQNFLAQTGGHFDIIVDDGGHTMEQQRNSFKILWDSVVPGGIYFVEDLATSYILGTGGAVGKQDTFMGDLKNILDDMNKFPGVPDVSPHSKDIITFEFAQEIVALTKFSFDN